MPRRASALPALALAGATVALAACGSSGGGSSGGGAQAASGTAAGADKFQQCLKDNGVTRPNRPGGGQGGNGYGPPPGAGGAPGGGPGVGGGPGAGGPGGNDPKFRKALQACAKYRPDGARGGGAGGGGQQDIKAFTPYLTCLKDQGLDVKVSDGFNALRNLKRDDTKVQAALKSCQSKLPQRPQGAPGAASPGATTAGTT
jgi:hypothetical protein